MPKAAAKRRFTSMITAQVDDSLKAWVDAECERRATTVSAFIRQLLVAARSEQLN